MISQLEILHKLGYTHGDLKFQNICISEHRKTFTIIDFALVTKIFHRNGIPKKQESVKEFYGNSLFSSDSMVNLLTTGRKDDLESMMYILCFLHSGTLPIIEFINQNIDKFDMSLFMTEILKFRKEAKEANANKVKLMLPGSYKSAF